MPVLELVVRNGASYWCVPRNACRPVGTALLRMVGIFIMVALDIDAFSKHSRFEECLMFGLKTVSLFDIFGNGPYKE